MATVFRLAVPSAETGKPDCCPVALAIDAKQELDLGFGDAYIPNSIGNVPSSFQL